MLFKKGFFIGGFSILTVAILFTSPIVVHSTGKPSSPLLTIGDGRGGEQAMPRATALSFVPLSFTENRGQFDETVKFRACAGRANIWITNDGVYYHFIRPVADANQSEPPADTDQTPFERQALRPIEYEYLLIKVSFVGANSRLSLAGEEMTEHKCNFFLGNDSQDWQTNVPNFRAVRFAEVYPGIDLKYYGNGKRLEYDFIVAPGADYSTIQVKYEGADSIAVNEAGELVVSTAWGTVIEQRPVVYQRDGDQRIALHGEYALRSGNSFGFHLSEDYNPALPVVIDPVLIYSTYIGGTESEPDWDIAVDVDGNAYLAGYTLSPDFPTVNPLQGTWAGGMDAFVCKLNATGDALVYATYLGGGWDEMAFKITVDAAGNAYVTGFTESSDFPTNNALQPTLAGQDDAFIAKLNPSGNALIYSTFLGGSFDEFARAISVDDLGNAYITGQTMSGDFPTVDAFQASHAGGSGRDAFLCKLNPDASALVYSTYFGGTMDEQSWGVVTESDGHVTITGFTRSADFPTYNALQPAHAGGRDAYIAKFSPAGNALVYSTYLGGTSNEVGRAIAVDAAGNAYITGETKSDDFPTVNALQPSKRFDYDIYISKLNPTGSALIYSTFLGGDGLSGIYRGQDYAYSIDVDQYGNAFAAGHSGSQDFPLADPVQASYGGGNWDAIVFGLNAAGDVLLFSSFLGGSDQDFGHGVAVDQLGNIYLAGYTESVDFPVTNAIQGVNAGARDIYAAKISISSDVEPPQITCPPDITIGCGQPTDPLHTGFAAAVDNIDPNPTISYADVQTGSCPQGATITRTWTATDASGNSSACVQIITLEPPTLKIEKTHNTYQGRQEEVSITLEGNMFEMGGFDFLIAYDASALTFIGAEKGQLLEDCDWEYFTYRYGADDNCGDGCPSGLVRIIAIADMPNGVPTPSCYGPPDVDPHELFSLSFFVTGDMTFGGMYIPIKFFWADCGDNTVSSIDGQTLYLDDAIYDFTGNLLWDEDNDDQFPEDARPQGLGAPDVCLEGGGPDKPTPTRFIDFWNGGIDIIPIDSIDVKGDINLNGVANEIADAVLFANYFLYGPSVWDPLYYEGQIAATDINNDGVVLTVADLVYLIRIITGDASPYPKLAPDQLPAAVDWRTHDDQLVVDFFAKADAGAVLLAFDHHGADFGDPTLSDRASSMTMISHNNGAQLRVLLYSMELGVSIAAGKGTILTVPIITADPGLVLAEAEATDYYGNMMTVEIGRPTYVPKEFALFQNIPNPFNATTRIDFNLPEASEVTLAVYDALGRKVATLVQGHLEPGAHHIEWDAHDDHGAEVASGIYFYRITTSAHQASRKMVLVK